MIPISRYKLKYNFFGNFGHKKPFSEINIDFGVKWFNSMLIRILQYIHIFVLEIHSAKICEKCVTLNIDR